MDLEAINLWKTFAYKKVRHLKVGCDRNGQYFSKYYKLKYDKIDKNTIY